MPAAARHLAFEDTPGSWRLSVAAPDDDLAPLVRELWEVRGALSAFRERVLPNGCAELMVNLGPTHRMVTDEGASDWEHAWYSGVHERAIFIESLHGTHLVSARLHPLGARELFGDLAPAHANRVVDLRAVLGADADALREELLAADAPEARFAIMEGFLRGRRGGVAVPAFVREAAQRIEAAHGAVRISELHESLGISRKHLAVTFARAMGISAKAYAQVLRFAWTAARLQESVSVDWSRLASEAGYADQSHLVRDFRRVANANPTEFLRQQTPDGSALLLDDSG